MMNVNVKMYLERLDRNRSLERRQGYPAVHTGEGAADRVCTALCARLIHFDLRQLALRPTGLEPLHNKTGFALYCIQAMYYVKKFEW